MGKTCTYRFRPTILKDSKELGERGFLIGTQNHIKNQIRSFKKRGFALCLEKIDPTEETEPRLLVLVTLIFVGETETIRIVLYPPQRGLKVNPYPAADRDFIELCLAQLQRLFFNHPVHRIEWLLPDDRPELQALAEAIGFTLEGRLRSALATDFYYQDALMVSLLRPENALSNYGFVNFGWFLVAVFGDDQWVKTSDLLPYGKTVENPFLYDCLAAVGLIDHKGVVSNQVAQLEVGGFLFSGKSRLRAVEQGCRELSGYILGERSLRSAIDPTQGTEFQRQVWAALRTIPYGQVQSYEDVANHVLYYSGLDQSEVEVDQPVKYGKNTDKHLQQNYAAGHFYARAVGAACAANPFLLFVPCHRVISKDGKLTGFSSGVENKGHLLDYEIMGVRPEES